MCDKELLSNIVVVKTCTKPTSGGDPARRRTSTPIYIKLGCRRTNVMVKSKFTPEQKIQIVLESIITGISTAECNV